MSLILKHVRQYVVTNAQNTKTDEIVLHQQVDTVGVSGCHVVVRSILVDQQIGPEVFVMICGVLQKDASVHRGHFWFAINNNNSRPAPCRQKMDQMMMIE